MRGAREPRDLSLSLSHSHTESLPQGWMRELMSVRERERERDLKGRRGEREMNSRLTRDDGC